MKIPYDPAIHGPLGIPAPKIPYDQWPADDLRSALVHAADGEETWARELLAAGANPTGMPLIMAIQCGELEIVRLFIAAGTDVDRDWARTTPLIHAVTGGELEIVRARIDAGANVNKPDEKGLPLQQVKPGRRGATDEDWAAIRRMLLIGGAIDPEGV